MSFRRSFSEVLATAALLIAAACSNHPASDSVKAFTIALSDSAWTDAWSMLTPSSQAAWDSTAAVMKRFGYTESLHYLSTLETEISPEEFEQLNGEVLFVRMMETYPEVRELSGAVRNVELRDSLTALVTVATVDGPQIIPVRLVDQEWLLDLTSIAPPAPLEE